MSQKSYQTYEEKNKGKRLHEYRITRPGAKHFRNERKDGVIVRVCYGGPDVGAEIEVRNVIRLTAEGAVALRHMRLVPVSGGPSPNDPAPERVVVPADWQKLGDGGRKHLASRISGRKITRTDTADQILAEYTKSDKPGDADGKGGGEEDVETSTKPPQHK